MTRNTADLEHILLDDVSLQKYPLKSCLSRYLRYKNAKNVALRRIEERHLSSVMDVFPQIDTLTMIDMKIFAAETVHLLPHSLKRLEMIRVYIEEVHLCQWLGKMRKSLLSLHIDRVETFFTYLGHVGFDWQTLPSYCPNLQSLSIYTTEQTVVFEVGWKTLNNFELTGPFIRQIRTLWPFPNLETLYVAAPELRDPIPIHKLQNLKSCTLDKLPAGAETHPNLRHLKILNRLDPKEKLRVDSLALKLETVQVEFFELMHTNGVEEDLILKKLDTNCLVKIMGYLDQEDRIKLTQVNTMMRKITIENGFKYLFLPPNSNQKVNRPLAEKIGPFVLGIDLSDENYQSLLPLFTALVDLTILNVYVTCDSIALWPTQLASFSLPNILVDRTGDKLDIYQMLGFYFGQLQGLKKLQIGHFLHQRCLQGCLLRNKDTLEDFHINFGGKALQDYRWLWPVLGACPNLTTLTLQSYSMRLEDPTVSYKELCTFILSHLGHLKNLYVGIPLLVGFGEAFLRNGLPLLEDFAFFNKAGMLSERDLKGLCSLKSLRKIQMGRATTGNVRALVEALPLLTSIQLPNFWATMQFKDDLMRYLKEKGRELTFIYG